jgi:UDP-N-acetylglucosamine:LPS N-acetylglucosamine transferase
MVLDKEAKETLVPAVLELFSNPGRQAALAAAIRQLAKPHADIDIARRILDIIERKTPAS